MPSPGRLVSIDVLRGAAIAAMILVNNQFTGDAYPQLLHSPWNGLTLADTVFPCFLFVMGVSLSLSTAARMARGDARGQILEHAVRRSVLLYLCGLIVDEVLIAPHRFPFVMVKNHLQLTGVLEKIAFCYLAAILIVLWTGPRGLLAAIVVLNGIYLALLFLFPVPGCGAGVLTMNCNFPGWLDATVLAGHTWGVAGVQDPDGLGTLMPAITSVLFGVLAGQLILGARTRRPVLLLAAGGGALVAVSFWLDTWVPINKPMWTTSYAIGTAGLAAICLAACVWIVDVRRWERPFRPLEVLGVNAIAAYLISRLATDVSHGRIMERFYDGVCRRVASPPGASLLFATTILAGVYGLAWIMYRRGWYLKL